MDISAQIINKRGERNLVPVDFEITDWEALKVYFDQLIAMEPASADDLGDFLKKVSELEAIVKEDMAWRYINMTRDTESEELRNKYQFFVEQILPHLSVYEDQLNRKIAEHPHFNDLDEEVYLTYTRSLKKQIELFREENIPLVSQAQMTSQQYGATVGSMSIEHEGETMTLQQAARLLEDKDRALRESVWRKVGQRRAEDTEKIHGILDKLIELRTQIAKNSGFTYFSEYIFPQLGRFDYQPKDTLAFHHAVETVAKPVYLKLMEERKQVLGVDTLKPWDLAVDIFGDEPLKPFEQVGDLISRSIKMLGSLNPVLGNMIQHMEEKGFLDLESRMGKAPGGYNYPLAETGVPFIFMNATGSQSDVTTMLHESGHAVHSFLTHDLSLNAFKDTPSEIAELASMTMELLTLESYHYMYPEEKERKRAIKEQLVRCIMIFPWIAAIDAFQKWLYEHPEHTHEERGEAWTAVYKRFHGDAIDWSGLEDHMSVMWQKQLHIFEVPFYYIEYAIAQLGALAIWKNYKENEELGLSQYIDALKMGYTKPIPDAYKAAGISFDFSADYMRECLEFCLAEYQKIEI